MPSAAPVLVGSRPSFLKREAVPPWRRIGRSPIQARVFGVQLPIGVAPSTAVFLERLRVLGERFWDFEAARASSRRRRPWLAGTLSEIAIDSRHAAVARAAASGDLDRTAHFDARSPTGRARSAQEREGFARIGSQGNAAEIELPIARAFRSEGRFARMAVFRRGRRGEKRRLSASRSAGVCELVDLFIAVDHRCRRGRSILQLREPALPRFALAMASRVTAWRCVKKERTSAVIR